MQVKTPSVRYKARAWWKLRHSPWIISPLKNFFWGGQICNDEYPSKVPRMSISTALWKRSLTNATSQPWSRKCCPWLATSGSMGLMTVFDAILTGRQSGQKLQCLYGNPIANNFFQNWIFHNLWIKTLKYLEEDRIHQVWKMWLSYKSLNYFFQFSIHLSVNFFPANGVQFVYPAKHGK